jgi:hypothetical protein
VTVRASVINLTALTPSPQLKLVFDTNILFWLGSSRATEDVDIRTRVRPYSTFISRGANAGVSFYCTVLSLVEAMHNLEVQEFKRAMPNRPHKEIKIFRQNSANREAVAQELESFWASVRTLATVLPAQISEDRASAMISNKQYCQADAYDLAIVETVRALGYKVVVSDDADLLTYDCDIIVATANPAALQYARDQGKIISPTVLDEMTCGVASTDVCTTSQPQA